MELKALVAFATKEISPGAGQVFTCSAELAEDLIRAGYAEKIGNKAVKEAANEDQRADNIGDMSSPARKRSRSK